MLRPYVRDQRPVIVAVDGGADAILEQGLKPDMIVGDMDSASDAALRSGAELVVHAYPDGRAPGRERLDRLGLPYKVVPAPATSEDVAMLVASEKGAELIVIVGSHFNLIEFLDKNRKGMSSTFLTRLRVGEILVDTKGVSRLYRPSAGGGPIAVRRARGARDADRDRALVGQPRRLPRPRLAEDPGPARPRVARGRLPLPRAVARRRLPGARDRDRARRHGRRLARVRGRPEPARLAARRRDRGARGRAQRAGAGLEARGRDRGDGAASWPRAGCAAPRIALVAIGELPGEVRDAVEEAVESAGGGARAARPCSDCRPTELAGRAPDAAAAADARRPCDGRPRATFDRGCRRRLPRVLRRARRR